MSEALEQLKEDFALLEDWEDRYQLLLDLGRALPPLAESEKTEATRVPGCVSQVWMVADSRPEDPDLRFRAESDSLMVKGLIGILRAAYDGLPKPEAAAVQIEAVFQDLKLEEHLSPNRRNGFFAMVGRLREMARGQG